MTCALAQAAAAGCDGVVGVDTPPAAESCCTAVPVLPGVSDGAHPVGVTARAVAASAVAGVSGAWVQVVEQVPAMQFCIGSGAVLPNVEAVIRGLRTEGAATIR